MYKIYVLLYNLCIYYSCTILLFLLDDVKRAKNVFSLIIDLRILKKKSMKDASAANFFF